MGPCGFKAEVLPAVLKKLPIDYFPVQGVKHSSPILFTLQKPEPFLTILALFCCLLLLFTSTFSLSLSRNLLVLKGYDGNVEDLALNFTVVNNELGEKQVCSINLAR